MYPPLPLDEKPEFLPKPGFGIKDKGPFRIECKESSSESGAGRNGIARRPENIMGNDF